MEKRKSGVVQEIDPTKGYGFIMGDVDKVRYFFHHTAVPNEGFHEMIVGEHVTFVGMESHKGPRAGAVERED
jgi:cold shock CspA family protein